MIDMSTDAELHYQVRHTEAGFTVGTWLSPSWDPQGPPRWKAMKDFGCDESEANRYRDLLQTIRNQTS